MVEKVSYKQIEFKWSIFYKLVSFIEYISKLQKLLIYPLIALVLITCFDILARSVFNYSVEWAYDVETELFSVLIILSWAYALYKETHVRISVLSDYFLSLRNRHILIIINYLLFFLPFLTVIFFYGVSYAWDSWTIREISTVTPWQPIIYPVKALIPLAALMAWLQGVAEIIKHLMLIINGGK